MPLFTTKPEQVEAFRWTGRARDLDELFTLIGTLAPGIRLSASGEVAIQPTEQDKMLNIQVGDWLVKRGRRLSSYTHAEFQTTFDPVAVP